MDELDQTIESLENSLKLMTKEPNLHEIVLPNKYYKSKESIKSLGLSPIKEEIRSKSLFEDSNLCFMTKKIEESLKERNNSISQYETNNNYTLLSCISKMKIAINILRYKIKDWKTKIEKIKKDLKIQIEENGKYTEQLICVKKQLNENINVKEELMKYRGNVLNEIHENIEKNKIFILNLCCSIEEYKETLENFEEKRIVNSRFNQIEIKRLQNILSQGSDQKKVIETVIEEEKSFQEIREKSFLQLEDEVFDFISQGNPFEK